jgi:predicted acyl esterase
VDTQGPFTTAGPEPAQYVTARDGTRVAIDLFVYLEDVDERGHSQYITEGCLRASHRAVSAPPHDRLGLPYHRSLEQGATKLPDGSVELVFDLLPAAQRFRAGHRIRIAITCADRGNYRTLPNHLPPSIDILRDTQHPSGMTLPVAPRR